MSFVKIMIHAVWRTKNSERILLSEPRNLLLKHIKENAKKKGIFIDTINAEPEHVHCLFSYNTDMSLSKALQLIKGEASFWANQQKLIRTKLYWAVDYYAVSVSESQLPKIRAYIRNQHEHHRRFSFAEEYEEFIKAYQG
ncbi:MAG: IS200/IS605 family transposase [Bacteroidota bacterium]|nr:IS200/IS605 family transposase [Bacteroidota bacterium]